MSFYVKEIKHWDKFLEFKKDELTYNWVYRGQGDDYPLANSLERIKNYFNVEWSEMPGIEEQMIRNFRRNFQGETDVYLDKDLLYCISLMQHHGAPTRLLDFTWSLYIGVFFAFEKAKKDPVLWCINVEWIDSELAEITGRDLAKARWEDEKRDDNSFKEIYMSTPPKKLAQIENPIRLNKRQIIQRGIFYARVMFRVHLRKI